MIKFLNKYFAVVMMIFALSSAYLYKLQIKNFVNNSVEHTFVISSNITQENKEKLKNKIENLTFQDVVIEEKEDTILVRIKCPPDKFSFFSKLICESAKTRREK
jgi:hypothetical protein